MQLGAAHAEAAGAGKVTLGHEVAVEIADAAEGEAAGIDADLPQAHHGVGHQPLAAGLVDRWTGAVDHRGGEPGEARADGGRESRGAAADDQEIRRPIGHQTGHARAPVSREAAGSGRASSPAR